MQANLDGSNPQPIVTGQNNPAGLALNGSNLHWTQGGGTIMQANLDGSNPQPIATTSYAVPLSEARDMAVYSGILYWTGTAVAGGSAMAMYQVSIPALTTLPPPATPQMLPVGGAYLAIGPQ
jgi:hypothetical protein